jgi:large conductance mechanosensitive channel
MFKEFREFALRGNVMDLAIGVIIGAAFGKIVTSLVNDLIMPLVGLLVGGRTNFSDYFIALDRGTYASLQAARDASAPVFAYGAFITAVLDFLIIALVIFMIVKAVNAFRRKEAETPSAPPAPTREEALLTEIRDLLKK